MMRDAAMQVVDLHPMRLAALGASVATGWIEGREVKCVSANLQVEATQETKGYASRRERRRYQLNLGPPASAGNSPVAAGSSAAARSRSRALSSSRSTARRASNSAG